MASLLLKTSSINGCDSFGKVFLVCSLENHGPVRCLSNAVFKPRVPLHIEGVDNKEDVVSEVNIVILLHYSKTTA